MNDQTESLGRIEVAPEVLVTIARVAVLEVDGVSRMAPPGERGRPFRRGTSNDGIVLHMSEDNKLHFDVYVMMDPHVDIMETSRSLQTAVVEAMNKMVGIDVAAVNIHVEDVLYDQGEAA